MRTLLLDIETSPNVGYFWGLFKQNISHKQVEEASRVLCWSAKWLGEDEVMFDSEKKSKPKRMLQRMHKLLEEADVVVHFNGKKFDMPVLHKEFLLHRLPPPAPPIQVDIYKLFKDHFRFESNKLDNITYRLDIGSKLAHEGFSLWTDCMRGDKEAWKRMEAYNRQDVVLLEKLYLRVRPWIPNHPSYDAYSDVACCPHCGSEKFGPRGWRMTKVLKYRQYRCKDRDCGATFRGNRTISLRRSERMVTIPR